MLWSRNVLLGPSRQFPAIDALAKIGNLDVVEGLLEGAGLLLPLLIRLVDRAEALWERVLVDVVLVVQVRVWITSHTLIEDLSFGALGVDEHVVDSAKFLKIL